MVDLRLERRQSEGLKRFEAALKMPVGYYWGGKCFPLIYDLPAYIYYLVHTELALEILWVGEHLKAKLIALNCNTPSLHCVDVFSEVIVPEVVAHLIASDLRIQYA
jgi:hypothetical protein